MARHDDQEAARLFRMAHVVDPVAADPLRYLSILGAGTGEVDKDEIELDALEIDTDRAHAIFQAMDKFQSSDAIKAVVLTPLPIMPGAKRALKPGARIATQAEGGKDQVMPESFMIDDIVRENPSKPTLRIPFGKFVIVEGKNIQKFLVIDPIFIRAKEVARDRIQVDAVCRGGTFLHIWDDAGRRTLYVEVTLPIMTTEDHAGRTGPVEHSEPFQVKYSNDWASYYTGTGTGNFSRQTRSFYEQVGVEGQTPYGALDASATLTGIAPVRDVPTYTVGLSQVPFPGTTDFNVRLFDAARGVSPATLPTSYLRGSFVDFHLFEDAVGIAVTQGQLRPMFGVYSSNSGSSEIKSYVNGFKLVLFPKNKNNYLAFNYAQSYGADRNPSAAPKAYSIEASRKIDKTTLNAELARNSEGRNALTGGIKWANGSFRTALNARDVNRSYTAVTGPALGQGDIGALWTTDIDLEKLTVATVVDAYRNRQFFNPNDPGTYNYDTHLNVRVPINTRYMVDMDMRYLDARQELSPRRSSQVSARLMRNLDLWEGRLGSTYVGMSRQQARYADSPASAYDRVSAITGIQLPLAAGLSYNANYEYTWLTDILSGQMSNPNVFQTGVSYFNSFNDKTSGNFSLMYRKEQGSKSANSFLAGEDSLGASASLSYRPNKDVSYFMDAGLRRVWSLTSNSVYNNMDLHGGMRMNWGVPVVWDPEGTISGIVFKDKDGDGTWKAGEKGLPGIKIKVGDKEVTTDAEGRYKINVRAKKVLVTPVFESLPAGYVFSTPTSYRVAILQSQTQVSNFGLTTNSGIYGVAFVDKNGNNAPDQGDQFIPNVRVVLDGKLRLLTDSRGVYFFRNIAEGKHTLMLDMKEMPSNVIPLVKIKNEIDLQEGMTYVSHIPLKFTDKKPAE